MLLMIFRNAEGNAFCTTTSSQQFLTVCLPTRIYRELLGTRSLYSSCVIHSIYPYCAFIGALALNCLKFFSFPIRKIFKTSYWEPNELSICPFAILGKEAKKLSSVVQCLDHYCRKMRGNIH